MTALPPLAQTATHWPPVVPALTIPLPVRVRVPDITSKPSPRDVRVLPFKSTVRSFSTNTALEIWISAPSFTFLPAATAILSSDSFATALLSSILPASTSATS